MSIDSIGNFSNTYVIVTGSIFADNSAEGFAASSDFSKLGGLGGALRIFAAVLWLDRTKFQQNTAATVAGAVFFNQSCALVGMPLICL